MRQSNVNTEVFLTFLIFNNSLNHYSMDKMEILKLDKQALLTALRSIPTRFTKWCTKIGSSPLVETRVFSLALFVLSIFVVTTSDSLPLRILAYLVMTCAFVPSLKVIVWVIYRILNTRIFCGTVAFLLCLICADYLYPSG